MISPWEVEVVGVVSVAVEEEVVAAEEVVVVGDAQFPDASENCAEFAPICAENCAAGRHLQLGDRQRGLDPPVLERVLEEHV